MKLLKENEQVVCFSCSNPPTLIPCEAVKVWKFRDNDDHVTVMHKGEHTCYAKQKGATKEDIMDELGHFSVRCPEKSGILMNGKVSPGQAVRPAVL